MNSQISSGANRFADYFVICGLDLSSGLEPDRFAGELLLLVVFWQVTIQKSFLRSNKLHGAELLLSVNIDSAGQDMVIH
jgi:hypothetical protein